MPANLSGKTVAILVADGFEQVEFTSPREALEKAGAKTVIVSLKPGRVQGWKHHDKADTFKVDKTVTQARADDYDALLLPGGVANPDQLRADPNAVVFVRDFFEQHKPVAAICHGPWTLIDAGVVKGRRVTSYPSIKTDLINAGAEWTDEEVVVDNGLVTSRNPGDLPAFNAKLVEEVAEGIHASQRA
ncbi:MAG TPA: type 1 glutamine amidotransferase domain-containing protein [Phycisphaerales bacterium]|nr:type 1 glutamine amidotransferase domain-containing protein [Phycisphaerales bacterium]